MASIFVFDINDRLSNGHSFQFHKVYVLVCFSRKMVRLKLRSTSHVRDSDVQFPRLSDPVQVFVVYHLLVSLTHSLIN